MLDSIYFILNNNYISILLLILVVVLAGFNISDKPKGTELFVLLLGLLAIHIFLNCMYGYTEYLVKRGVFSEEDYKYIIRFYRFRAFMEHVIYCLIPYIEVMLIMENGLKKKLLMSIPLAVDVIAEGLSMFGIPVIFGYFPNTHWRPGTMRYIPYVATYFYLIVLLYYSYFMVCVHKSIRLGSIILSISLVTIITGYLEYKGIIVDYMDEVVLIDFLLYYEFFFMVYREKLKMKLLEGELEIERDKNALLLAQISPHFVYNCLSVIRYLCRQDREEAVDTIDHFSDYLRYNMEMMTKNECVPFDMELKLVDDYLFMEEKRFGDKIRITKNIETADFMIPPLTLQPLIENAIKHGLLAKKTGGNLAITVKCKDQRICICIEDDGIGFDTSILETMDQSRHIGIINARTRLKNMAGGTLEIESAVGTGTKVKIEL